MFKSGVVFVAALSASLAAFAAPATNNQTIAPLNDLYDTVWIRGEDGMVKTLDQVADDLSRYDVVFFWGIPRPFRYTPGTNAIIQGITRAKCRHDAEPGAV